MKADQRILWTKIAAFELDDPTSAFPFSIRLARENGWTLRFAQQAVEEYKRFVFLAATAGHKVCPSETVDAVWHLHLCYSRSYWQDLCDDILGCPLHHEPTQGGVDQLEKHRLMYEQTLAAYRDFFAEQPPRAIWPQVDERFQTGGYERHVNTAKYWIVPKPRWPGYFLNTSRPTLGVLFSVAVIPTLGAAWNPLDMQGPQFLQFFVLLLCVAVVGAYVLRRFILAGNEGEHILTKDLHPLEIAMLAGRDQQAIYVALSQLVYLGYVEFRTIDESVLYAAKPLNKNVHPLTQAIYKAIESSGEASLKTVWNAGRPHAARIGAKLEKAGLLVSTGTGFLCRALPVLLISLVLVLGMLKIGVGLERNKPVGLLVLLCLANVVVACLFMIRPWRSKQGNSALRELKKSHTEIKRAENIPAKESELLMQWCLYGLSTMLLTGGVVAILHNWIQPEKSRNSSGGWGVGCGGGCGVGCGGGGGGCGGGCGGCGGD